MKETFSALLTEYLDIREDQQQAEREDRCEYIGNRVERYNKMEYLLEKMDKMLDKLQ